MTVALLFLVSATVAAMFYVRHRQKAEETCFTAWWRNTLGPVQQEPPTQRLPPPAAEAATDLDPEYHNVCPRQQSRDVVYSTVTFKKGSNAKPTRTPQMDDQEHLVTYAVLPSLKPSWDSATRVRASEGGDSSRSDIYENVPHPDLHRP
ncbi:hypothetical protein Y1Q_0017392 [Alligator mississippiensis]|uniref:Uncharacterized protein n=2 Tax=Alligator mississippiensis TaxID=8496 RepID=A0A151P4K4_ALLMI|nr:hypothetical protein Y1Q_0017392 [Alligator mississippiensis]